MNHTVSNLTAEFTWARDRLFEKNACEAILDICKENPRATVESRESKEKSKWRPLPLDTVVSLMTKTQLFLYLCKVIFRKWKKMYPEN